jgi:hypothetical protein
MKDVQYVLCSPMYRAFETTVLAFGDRLSQPRVSKGFPWSELRECASTDDPENCKPVSTLHHAGHTLDEIKKQAEDRPVCSFSECFIFSFGFTQTFRFSFQCLLLLGH